MSHFEDYSNVAKTYGKERTAMGADTIVGLLHVYGGKPLKVGYPASSFNVIVNTAFNFLCTIPHVIIADFMLNLVCLGIVRQFVEKLPLNLLNILAGPT